MYEIIKSNWHKTKIIASFGIAITLLIYCLTHDKIGLYNIRESNLLLNMV